MRIDSVEDQLYKNSKLKTQIDSELEELAAKTAELENQKVNITAENLELEKQIEEHRQVRLRKENEVNEDLGKLKVKKNTVMQKIKLHEEKLANLNQMKPVQKKTYSKVASKIKATPPANESKDNKSDFLEFLKEEIKKKVNCYNKIKYIWLNKKKNIIGP